MGRHPACPSAAPCRAVWLPTAPRLLLGLLAAAVLLGACGSKTLPPSQAYVAPQYRVPGEGEATVTIEPAGAVEIREVNGTPVVIGGWYDPMRHPAAAQPLDGWEQYQLKRVDARRKRFQYRAIVGPPGRYALTVAMYQQICERYAAETHLCTHFSVDESTRDVRVTWTAEARHYVVAPIVFRTQNDREGWVAVILSAEPEDWAARVVVASSSAPLVGRTFAEAQSAVARTAAHLLAD
jgi:hypothetical protein